MHRAQEKQCRSKQSRYHSVRPSAWVAMSFTPVIFLFPIGSRRSPPLAYVFSKRVKHPNVTTTLESCSMFEPLPLFYSFTQDGNNVYSLVAQYERFE